MERHQAAHYQRLFDKELQPIMVIEYLGKNKDIQNFGVSILNYYPIKRSDRIEYYDSNIVVNALNDTRKNRI